MKKVLLITALVFGLGVAGFAGGVFSGSWATDVTVTTPQTPTFTVWSVLTAEYTTGGWTFRSVSRLRHVGWDRQEFFANGAIGAFTFTNRLRFDPDDVAFTFLRSTAAVSIAGVDLEGRLLIVPDGSGFRARFSAPVEDLTFAATAYFGSLAFDPAWPCGAYRAWHVIQTPTHTPIFRGLDVDITMPFYSTTLTIDADFVTDLGFQDITFTVPEFPLGIPGFTLDLSVKYTLEKKTVTVTPDITLVDWVHFQPFITVDGLIDGLVFEGLRLVWDVTDAVRFRYFWDADPVLKPSWDEVRIVPIGVWWKAPHHQYQQMVELRYKAAPITLTMAGAWLPDDMPMFPNRIDIDLAVADVMPGFDVRFGVDFRAAEFHAVSFGFTVTW